MCRQGASSLSRNLGDDAIERLQIARRAGLTQLLEGWDPEAHPEIGEMVRRLAHELLADDDKLLADATASASASAFAHVSLGSSAVE